MRIHRLATILLFGQLAHPSAVGAQVSDGLRIVITQHDIRPNGGERLRGGSGVDAEAVGQTRSVTLLQYRPKGCGTFVGDTADIAKNWLEPGHSPDGTKPRIDSAWTVDITPIRVSGDAATFGLKWLRSHDKQRPSSTPGGATELTLRPGESVPLDIVSLPSPTASTEPCVFSLRVGVQRRPEPDRDRRLLAVDMWLVERLADGTERSQPLALRGLYGKAIPFYFDRIVEGAVSFDLFGELEVAAGSGSAPVTITLKNRVIEPPRPGAPPFFALIDFTDARRLTATLALDEVVSVALPGMGQDRNWGAAFAKRTLALRIRVRQLR